jgi:hypothetical protein
VEYGLEIFLKAVRGNVQETPAEGHLFPMQKQVADEHDEEEHKDNPE